MSDRIEQGRVEPLRLHEGLRPDERATDVLAGALTVEGERASVGGHAPFHDGDGVPVLALERGRNRGRLDHGRAVPVPVIFTRPPAGIDAITAVPGTQVSTRAGPADTVELPPVSDTSDGFEPGRDDPAHRTAGAVGGLGAIGGDTIPFDCAGIPGRALVIRVAPDALAFVRHTLATHAGLARGARVVVPLPALGIVAIGGRGGDDAVLGRGARVEGRPESADTGLCLVAQAPVGAGGALGTGLAVAGHAGLPRRAVGEVVPRPSDAQLDGVAVALSRAIRATECFTETVLTELSRRAVGENLPMAGDAHLDGVHVGATAVAVVALGAGDAKSVVAHLPRRAVVRGGPVAIDANDERIRVGALARIVLTLAVVHALAVLARLLALVQVVPRPVEANLDDQLVALRVPVLTGRGDAGAVVADIPRGAVDRNRPLTAGADDERILVDALARVVLALVRVTVAVGVRVRVGVGIAVGVRIGVGVRVTVSVGVGGAHVGTEPIGLHTTGRNQDQNHRSEDDVHDVLHFVASFFFF